MKRYVNKQTDKKKMILQQNASSYYSGNIDDFVSGVILVPIDKIKKMAESRSPYLGVFEVFFVIYFNRSYIMK